MYYRFFWILEKYYFKNEINWDFKKWGVGGEGGGVLYVKWDEKSILDKNVWLVGLIYIK